MKCSLSELILHSTVVSSPSDGWQLEEQFFLSNGLQFVFYFDPFTNTHYFVKRIKKGYKSYEYNTN